MKRRAAFGALLVAFGASAHASAYCRTRACNPAIEQCARDASNCITTGDLLYWPSSCVSFSTQQDGSAKYDISGDAFGKLVQTALDAWTSATCIAADGTDSVPSLRVKNLGTVACDQVEFNTSGANANVWMFRDDTWPYVGGEDALGLSTVHYDPDTGVIQDVDVEINAADAPLSTNGAKGAADLQSILTHEAGHFLGLSHTSVTGATMFAGYTLGDQSQRTLEPDDTAGICAAYPEGRVITNVNSSNPQGFDDCTPRRGLALECGGALPASSGDSNADTTAKGCSIARLTAPPHSPTVGPKLGSSPRRQRIPHDAFLVCGLVVVAVARARRMRLFRKRVASAAR